MSGKQDEKQKTATTKEETTTTTRKNKQNISSVIGEARDGCYLSRFQYFAKNFIQLCKSSTALLLRFWFLVSRPSMSPILQWPAIISNVVPRRAGMSKKSLRALRTPYFSRATTKSMRLNLNLYLRSFLGSLGGLRVLIWLTVTPFLVRRPEIEDYLCFQQVDRSYLNTVFSWTATISIEYRLMVMP